VLVEMITSILKGALFALGLAAVSPIIAAFFAAWPDTNAKL
jgi:hypothetical protein